MYELDVSVQVDGRQTLRYPPLPLATLSLQKEAITHLRLPGERMMKLAEELYQEGFISYPRTETDVFDLAYDLRVRSRFPCLSMFSAIAGFEAGASFLLCPCFCGSWTAQSLTLRCYNML